MKSELFTILLVCGLMLVGAEVFVPGGVLGVMGAIALIGAAIAGFAQFGPLVGSYIAVGILFLVGLTIVLWIKIFPRTRAGRSMTVANDLKTWKAADQTLASLNEARGEALSDLRPAGYARFGTRRVDVVTEGGMILAGRPVRVVKVESNRVVVAEIKEG